MPYPPVDPLLKDDIIKQQLSHLKLVIKYYGNTTNLAFALKITEPGVRNWWLSPMSANAAIKIEKLTDGLFKRELFRPDLFDLTWEKRMREQNVGKSEESA